MSVAASSSSKNIVLKKKTSIKSRGVDKAFDIAVYIILTFIFIVTLLPLIHVISSSFSSAAAVSSGQVVLWPVEFSIQGYIEIFKHQYIIPSFGNSIFYAVFGTIINVVLTVLAAYPLSRSEFKYKNIFTVFFMFTMFFSGGLIPSYMLMSNLNILNTRLVMLLCSGISIHNMIITRTFFKTTIPNELLEAAKIDGLGEFGIFMRIVLPLSKAGLAVITLYYAVGHWNVFFNAMVYLSDKEIFPLQLILREILTASQIDYSDMSVDVETLEALQGMADLLKYSLIVVASVPVMILYPFIQKHFAKGVMIGSVKG